MPRKRKGSACGGAEESTVDPTFLAQTEITANHKNAISKIALRCALGGEGYFITVVRGNETIPVVVSTRELKSYRRFLIAAVDQATRVFVTNGKRSGHKPRGFHHDLHPQRHARSRIGS